MRERMVNFAGLLLLLIGLFSGFVHCAPPQNCVPGKSESCTCPGGTTSAQICKADGSGYESCDCVGTKSETPTGQEAKGSEPLGPDEATPDGDAGTDTPILPPDKAPDERISPPEKQVDTNAPIDTGEEQPVTPDSPTEQSIFPDVPPESSTTEVGPEQHPDGPLSCGALTQCVGSCVDLQSDFRHCGKCSKVCTGLQEGCSKGLCVPKAGWAIRGGGLAKEAAYDIAVDVAGNSYVIGTFSSRQAQFGKTTLTVAGLADIFVAKLDYKGEFVWVQQFKSTKQHDARVIAVDQQQNVYIGGDIYGTTNFGSITLSSVNALSGFVAKLDPMGKPLWAHAVLGANIRGLAVTSKGELVASGSFTSTTNFGSIALTSQGSSDIFVAKLDANGKWLWSTRAGGLQNDAAGSIAIDGLDAILVVGGFSGQAAFGTLQLTHPVGTVTGFVAKLTNTGQWDWAKQLTGVGSHEIRAVATDLSDNVYIAGSIGLNGNSNAVTANIDNFSLTTTSKHSDGFVCKLDTKGNGVWAKLIGSCSKQVGCLEDRIYDLAVDDKSTIYLTGLTGGFELDGLTAKQADGSMFVLRLDSNNTGLSLVQAQGSNNEGYGIAVDLQHSVYVTGIFKTGAFGSTSLTSAGDLDFFVWKIP